MDEGVGQAGVIASPIARIAMAHLAEYPGDVHACTATREEQVVIELILLRRRALEGRALDRQYDRGIVWGQEDVPAKPVRLVFPSEGEALHSTHATNHISAFSQRYDSGDGVKNTPEVMEYRHTVFHAGSTSYQFGRPGSAYAFPVIRASWERVCLSSMSGARSWTSSHSIGSLSWDRNDRRRAR